MAWCFSKLKRTLLAYRLSLSLFIAGLVLSGLTAFPLLRELSVICSWLGISDPAAYETLSGFRAWIAFVFFGLQRTYAAFPFIGYGTDWLAFGHLIIASFFIGPFRDPIRNAWVLRTAFLRGRYSSRSHMRTRPSYSAGVAPARLLVRDRGRNSTSLLPPFDEARDLASGMEKVTEDVEFSGLSLSHYTAFLRNEPMEIPINRW